MKGYVIDLLEGLSVSVFILGVKMVWFTLLWQALLSNPALCSEVMQSHVSTDGVMRDVCDGSFVKTHPVFQKYPDALQFIICHDEIDVCNPLGSSAGIHLIIAILWVSTCHVYIIIFFIPCERVFHYLLRNIRPHFRSTLSAMQLLAIVKAEDLRTHGCQALLTPIIQQVNLLARVCMHMYVNIHCTKFTNNYYYIKLYV